MVLSKGSLGPRSARWFRLLTGHDLSVKVHVEPKGVGLRCLHFHSVLIPGLGGTAPVLVLTVLH